MRLVRWTMFGAAALLAAACAHIEAPSGGPEDKTPPALLVTRPDSLAVVPDWKGPVVLVFDERISERELDRAVLVSPLTSPVRVDHSGDELRVALRGGWQPGMIYHVTVLPALQDLFQNPRKEPLRFVFSTGPEIPETRAEGEVIDRITGKPQPDARVEAILAGDSLVYAIPSDTAGRFTIGHVPAGEYRLRAYQDQNRNRALDPFEPRDTAVARLAANDTFAVRFRLLLPDTTAPQIASARLEGRTLLLEFDDHLDPTQQLPPARVQVRSPQGTFVPVEEITIGRASAPQGEGARAAADTAAEPEPLPSQTLVVQLSEGVELEPDAEYHARVRRIRNLVGLETEDAETTFKAPAAPAKPEASPGTPGERG